MVLKHFRFALVGVLPVAALYALHHELGARAVAISSRCLMEMVLIIPPVFILLGLLDVWLPREMMIKYLGEHSGVLGVVISFALGSAAAGPLYGAFPVAAVLMKKGARFSNIIIFLGAWSTTKIPMFLFEYKSLGARFAIARLLVDVVGILVIAFAINKIVRKDHVRAIYDRVGKM